MKRSRTAPNGFSIPDMIMGMSIIAIAIVGIMMVQRNYLEQSNQMEIGLRAVSLGNSVMHTIRMHRFDENTSAPWDSTLGANIGESSQADFDDIDDFAGLTWDMSSDGFPGFVVTSRVFSIDLGTSWEDSIGAGGNFKRIIVSVDHDVLQSAVVFSSIMAGIE